MLVTAIVLITAALVFYTIGVWSEHRQRVLKWWHTAFFALGLAFDASGTYFMSEIAGTGATATTGLGGTLTSIMAVTGVLALALMAIHLAWAIIVLVRKRDAELKRFHKLSVVVWSIWLIPYFAGAIGANIR